MWPTQIDRGYKRVRRYGSLKRKVKIERDPNSWPSKKRSDAPPTELGATFGKRHDVTDYEQAIYAVSTYNNGYMRRPVESPGV